TLIINLSYTIKYIWQNENILSTKSGNQPFKIPPVCQEPGKIHIKQCIINIGQPANRKIPFQPSLLASSNLYLLPSYIFNCPRQFATDYNIKVRYAHARRKISDIL